MFILAATSAALAPPTFAGETSTVAVRFDLPSNNWPQKNSPAGREGETTPLAGRF
jgi:hypothetical protein